MPGVLLVLEQQLRRFCYRPALNSVSRQSSLCLSRQFQKPISVGDDLTQQPLPRVLVRAVNECRTLCAAADAAVMTIGLGPLSSESLIHRRKRSRQFDDTVGQSA